MKYGIQHSLGKSLDSEEDGRDYDTTEPFMEPISDPTQVESSVRRGII